MYYVVEVKDFVRIPPRELTEEVKGVIHEQLREKFKGFISKDLGFLIEVIDVVKIGEGTVLPENGGVYYPATFKVLSFKPEMHELVYGGVREITDFGLFLNIGPVDGMVHISQTMDDYVSFNKDKVLQGKETKKSLKVGDLCKARTIAISYKDIDNPRIGLVMRQEGLGNLEWFKEDSDDNTKSKNKEVDDKGDSDE